MSSNSEAEIFLTQNSFGGSIAEIDIEDLVAELFEEKKTGRGITAVTDKEIKTRNYARIPENTKKSTTWGIRVWDEWAQERNLLPVNDNDAFVVAPESSILKRPCLTLNCVFGLASLFKKSERKTRANILQIPCIYCALDYSVI